MSGVKVQKHLNINKLKKTQKTKTKTNDYFCASLTERFYCFDFDGTWESFTDQVLSAGVDVVGFRVREHKDCFEDNEPAVN